MKKCKSCLHDKEFEEFNACNANKDKLQSFCRDCQSKYFKKSYTHKKEKFIKSTTEWRQKNPDYKQRQSISRTIVRLLKNGGNVKHKKIKMTGDELRAKFPYDIANYGLTWKIVFDGIPPKFYRRKDIQSILSLVTIKKLD